MREIIPSRSLNNKSMLLGLEFQDLVFLGVSFYAMQVLGPSGDYGFIHIMIVGFLAAILSFIKIKYRKGFIGSCAESFLISITERIKIK